MRTGWNLCVVLALMGWGCGGAELSTPSASWEVQEDGEARQELAVEVVSPALMGPEERVAVQAPRRERLFANVAHYAYRVKVGPGPYDVITVHRVVRESAPWHAARAKQAVFMVHGDSWGFTGAFLASARSTQVPVNHSIAAYLAEQGVDVWGIDLRWVGVPQEVTDFTFMAGWNMGTDLRDVGTALALARAVRVGTQGSQDRMFLLGWSRGAMLGYAYLDAESQRPLRERRVDGFIPVDVPLRYAPEHDEQRVWACERYELLMAQRDKEGFEGGLLGTKPGLKVQAIGMLAALAPDAPSPANQGKPGEPQLTNRQFALMVAANTSALFTSFRPIVPDYHLTAGRLERDSVIPTGLTFTSEKYFFDFLQQSAPYQSINQVVETEGMLCGKDVPFDDHLADVKVPVLYVGAGGGVGEFGEYSLTLLGSRDVTQAVVHTHREGERAFDYGHADLLLANDARERVWKPMLQWMRAH